KVLRWVGELQRVRLKTWNRDEHLKRIEALLQEAGGCCRLIPDGKRLVEEKRAGFRESSSLLISDAGNRARLDVLKVKRALTDLRKARDGNAAKFFCRLYRARLLLWLRLDRREPGAYD